MKRALKKREKAVLENTTCDDVPVEQLNPINPRVNRSMPRKAAMIGLAISMGATSLLVTRQSDSARAAEPIGNQNTTSTLGAASDSEVIIPTKSAIAPENPVIVEPTAISQVSGLAAKLHGVASRETVVSSTPSQAMPAVNSSYAVAASGQLPQRSREQASILPLDNTKAQSNKGAYGVAGSQSLSLSTSQVEGVGISNEVNSQLKAQQEFALNRLQQKSNQLRQTLAQYRSDENKDSSVVTPLAQPKTVVETPVLSTQTATQSQNSTNTSKASLVSKLKHWSNAKELAPASSALTTPAAIANTPQTPYQVKPLDTQSVTANNYGTSVSELVKANSQGNPNQLQINQPLIPTTENSSNVTQTTLTNKVPTVGVSNTPRATDSSAVSSQLNSGQTNNSSVSVITPTTANTQFKPVSEPTPAILVAGTPVPQTSSTAANSYGMGGDSPVPVVQLAAKPKVKAKQNPRLRSLQDEIERLREKYRAQQSGHPSGNVVVPEVSQNNYDNDAPTQIYVAKPSNQAVPIAVPKPMGSEYNSQLFRGPTRVNQTNTEPINPEFKPNADQPRTGVATPPRGMDASQSLGSLRGTTVSPDLPPLAAVDRYLPKAIDETTMAAGGYIWPTKGVVTSGFGWRWGRMHKGIDIANSTGTPVYAAADGVIEKAGWNNGGYGNMVDIRHADGSVTRYGHNSKVLVQAGQQIHKGETIALMGSTGFSTGPHCHFEVHPAGHEAVNPVAFLPRL